MLIIQTAKQLILTANHKGEGRKKKKKRENQIKNNFIHMGSMFFYWMKNWAGSVISGNGSAVVPQCYEMQLFSYCSLPDDCMHA